MNDFTATLAPEATVATPVDAAVETLAVVAEAEAERPVEAVLEAEAEGLTETTAPATAESIPSLPAPAQGQVWKVKLVKALGAKKGQSPYAFLAEREDGVRGRLRVNQIFTADPAVGMHLDAQVIDLDAWDPEDIKVELSEKAAGLQWFSDATRSGESWLEGRVKKVESYGIKVVVPDQPWFSALIHLSELDGCHEGLRADEKNQLLGSFQVGAPINFSVVSFEPHPEFPGIWRVKASQTQSLRHWISETEPTTTAEVIGRFRGTYVLRARLDSGRSVVGTLRGGNVSLNKNERRLVQVGVDGKTIFFRLSDDKSNSSGKRSARHNSQPGQSQRDQRGKRRGKNRNRTTQPQG